MDRSKNILDELDRVVPARSKNTVIEGRAVHLIASAINLCQLIRESYGADEADDLIKRLLRSMATGDDRKFTRKIREMRNGQ